jgi:3'-phosphoadenosine 5'-phosphosulfate sulfotransferase (PAPS reductase)/FAD synthetase
MSRIVAWFSCGAASAAAAKLACDIYPERAVVAYCDTSPNEHPDNLRFLKDVERWIGRPILRLRSDDYATVDDVFMRTGYMAGIKGARCTVELKKMPRFAFQAPDDAHVFGFTSEEGSRIASFRANNPELDLWFPLSDFDITKQECFDMLTAAGVPLPTMYALGYRNNNCLGCVKATSARYWNMIRRDFPDVFDRRAAQSRQLGVRLTRVRGKRTFLDELPVDYLGSEPLENVSCGPECGPQQGKA